MSRVAVVDGDDATIRRLLIDALRCTDLRARAFEDEITALADLKEIPCDPLMIDAPLPDMLTP